MIKNKNNNNNNNIIKIIIKIIMTTTKMIVVKVTTPSEAVGSSHARVLASRLGSNSGVNVLGAEVQPYTVRSQEVFVPDLSKFT